MPKAAISRFHLVLSIAALVAGLVFVLTQAVKTRRGAGGAAGARPARGLGAVGPKGQRTGARIRPVLRSPRSAALGRPVSAGSGAGRRDREQDVIDDEYLLRFEDDTDLARFLRAARGGGLEVLGVLNDWRLVRVRSVGDDRLRDALAAAEGRVRYEHNAYVRLPRVPTGPGEGASADPRPFGPRAIRWLGVDGDNATWGRGVTVAILDTAISPHPSLAEDRIRRISLVSSPAGAPDDYAGHGTAVASLIAGSSVEVRGIAPGATLLGIEVLGADGTGDTFTLVQGILTAVDEGASVISLSVGTTADSSRLLEAIEFAVDRGVVVVAAAGNDGTDAVTFPAAYEDVLAVTAVDAEGERLASANYGEEIDIGAPGYGVYAAWTGDGVVSFSGTSAAVPFVSGAVASVLSQNDALSPADAAEIVLDYVDDNGAPNSDPEYGEGVLNIGRIQSRGEAGIYDLALSSHFIDEDESGEETCAVLVSVQNRGTERIESGELNVAVAGDVSIFSTGPLQVGEVVTRVVVVDLGRLSGLASVEILSTAKLSGVEDAVPDNDRRRSLLVLGGAEGE